MKLKLLLIITLFCKVSTNAQCGSAPPPLGVNPVYSVDLDNDGIATFDIAYYIEHYHRPAIEQEYGVSASGYTFDFADSQMVSAPLMYTNAFNNEICSLVDLYSGSGPTFDPQPPCFWTPLLVEYLRLNAVPFDGDMDGDGISNRMEDTNSNGNLMDDDDDNDGIINLLDNSVTLSITSSEKLNVKIYPNPISNGLIIFDKTINTATVYDFTGKLLILQKINSNSLDVSLIAAGSYLLKLELNEETIIKKIIIH